jgi:hypothetical protein
MAETETPKTESAPPATPDAAENNISPEDASKALMTSAALLQRAWLQAEVNIGQTISKQQPVSHGAFDGLRHLREQVEELDRANTAITRISKAQSQMQADAATKN